jgi:hypothetical protein
LQAVWWNPGVSQLAQPARHFRVLDHFQLIHPGPQALSQGRNFAPLIENSVLESCAARFLGSIGFQFNDGFISPLQLGAEVDVELLDPMGLKKGPRE